MQTSLISKLTPQPKYASHTTASSPAERFRQEMDGDDGNRVRESVMEMERGVGILGSAACLK